jgi:hypothetical protein
MPEPYNWAEASHVRPTSYPAPIPVSERLPEDDVYVLAWEAEWLVGHRWRGAWMIDGSESGRLTKPTHWLPLPPAP